jgi:hypothetical protein
VQSLLLKSLACFLVLTVLNSGCARNIVLHPVTDEDIRMDGDWVCMSQDYVKEVMKVRLGQ